MCFGRYALEVPLEAEVLWGSTSEIDGIIEADWESARRRAEAFIEEVLDKEGTAEITHNGVGPIDRSWQIRYYDDEISKEYGLHFSQTYVTKGDLTFIIRGHLPKEETEEAAVARLALPIKALRLRSDAEVPKEPGSCSERSFVGSAVYDDQETVNAGIYLPSFPDVSFSINSNKDAYGDFSKEEFESRKRGELSLLNRIEQARLMQGAFYPARRLLREGKRTVQHWRGEESLFRRRDGTHDFEWALVGTPRDIANPSILEARLYSKVKYNLVGAAPTASLSDTETVALWDRLLLGLKYRVKVPGAPAGSYYYRPQ